MKENYNSLNGLEKYNLYSLYSLEKIESAQPLYMYMYTCTVHLGIIPSDIFLMSTSHDSPRRFLNHVHVYYFLVPNPFPMYAVPALFCEGRGLGIRWSCSGEYRAQGGAESRWGSVCGVQF